MEKEIIEKLKDSELDGAAISFDPDEAEMLGAIDDGMPLSDVIEAEHDQEI